tara:strand:- start:111 stop:416 length:306 start_codon:yes stop_codon:yes gene_type:complete
MKSYIQGFITGGILVFSFFLLMGSDNTQVNAIEKEVVKIWELEKSQNKMINNNQIYISDLEKDINLYSKSINLNIKSIRKDFDKLINQLTEHCECYRNQIY